MNMLGKLFLKGLIVVIPAALTLAILWWLAAGAEHLLGGFPSHFLPQGWYIPGMGLIAAKLHDVNVLDMGQPDRAYHLGTDQPAPVPAVTCRSSSGRSSMSI